MTTLEQRFMAKVFIFPDGCWLWIASTARGGYGQFNDGRTMRRAHRWAYEHFVGPIPEGLDLDHLCRVRACVNPAHLEPVTRSVNLKRGYAARGVRTHCAQNHAFTPENTFQRPRGRGCRTCRNNASRVSKARARAARAVSTTLNPTKEYA